MGCDSQGYDKVKDIWEVIERLPISEAKTPVEDMDDNIAKFSSLTVLKV